MTILKAQNEQNFSPFYKASCKRFHARRTYLSIFDTTAAILGVLL